MIFLLLLALFGQVSALSDVELQGEELGKTLYKDLRRIRRKMRKMFADPLTVHDCTGRSIEVPLDQQMDVIGHLVVKEIPDFYFKDDKLFHRVMIADTLYIFEAEYDDSKINGSYRIQRYRKECPAMKIAEELNVLFMNIQNFTGILADPYYSGECGYKAFPYTHKTLEEDNKFEFRNHMSSTVQNAEFLKENEMRYETKMKPKRWWNIGSAAEFEFLAVRNESDGVFLIRREFKMC